MHEMLVAIVVPGFKHDQTLRPGAPGVVSRTTNNAARIRATVKHQPLAEVLVPGYREFADGRVLKQSRCPPFVTMPPRGAAPRGVREEAPRASVSDLC